MTTRKADLDLVLLYILLVALLSFVNSLINVVYVSLGDNSTSFMCGIVAMQLLKYSFHGKR